MTESLSEMELTQTIQEAARSVDILIVRIAAQVALSEIVRLRRENARLKKRALSVVSIDQEEQG